MNPPCSEPAPSQSLLRRNISPPQSVHDASRESALQSVNTKMCSNQYPEHTQVVRPRFQPSLDLFRNLLPARFRRSVGQRLAETNAEANEVNITEDAQRMERAERNQNEYKEAVPSYRPPQFRYNDTDSCIRWHAPSSPVQDEILPERPVNRILFTEYDSDENTPAPIQEDHDLTTTRTPENVEQETRDVVTTEEEQEVHVKVEPELVLLENDKSHFGIEDEPSPQPNNENAAEPTNYNDPSSHEGDQEETGDHEVQIVSISERRQPQRNRRRRGTKRGLSEVETGYSLRSRKPPSSSKRSKRTKYWLRPKSTAGTI